MAEYREVINRVRIRGEDYKRKKYIFLYGRKVAMPDNFVRSWAVKATPGGRWKVRQLLDGRFIAYVEQGSSKEFGKAFPTFTQASNYAHAAAYIARKFKSGSPSRVYRQQLLLKELWRAKPWEITPRSILGMLLSEEAMHYGAH